MNPQVAREEMLQQVKRAINWLDNRIKSGEGDSNEYKNELERVKKLQDEIEWFKSEY